MKKKTLSKVMVTILAGSMLFGCSSSKEADKPIIGVAQLVSHTSLNTIRDSFTERMEELGYVDGWLRLRRKPHRLLPISPMRSRSFSPLSVIRWVQDW